MTALVEIPFKSTTITAMSDEGKPLVSIRHICESLGIDRKAQQDKLKSKTWARGVMIPLRDSAGRVQEMHMIDRRTMTMWLATIDTNRIKEESRPLLEAFQNEAADALDAYFHEGGVINPNATAGQLDRIGAQLGELRAQAEIAQLLRGVVADDHLDNVGRIIMARAMGEKPVIEPLSRSLTTSDFLREKKVKTKESMRIRSAFGRRLSGAYLAHHGEEPPSAPETVNGRERDVKYYTERDRHLFEQVWTDHYAEQYEPSLMDELA